MDSKIKSSAPAKEKTKQSILRETQQQMPLLRNNYILMIVAGVMIVLGFILMTGSSSGLDAYNPDIFSTRRIVIGPGICFLGFVLMAIAIIVKPKDK